ncbi:hypothetical protein AVEN_167931-1 [Araneus ventricosus]|uniref:Uncharacterized protein n=1 Tax=Araneus ventricosus TaxID=182803 RepID=A0A4Y2PVP4_ARAVE|nr:hypothetical protein AVEN_275395-1 [Araneus ventricosus]GBN55969.1 hypothetical protein AVEN_88162-1 [Araneus ventricosus]GBN55975.1 hypothetical protein AVEN_88773-1 [Araneus ventricosus]GBN55995.1 hypothetical protein AVEN_167931-1 [Araneus ventricosus]
MMRTKPEMALPRGGRLQACVPHQWEDIWLPTYDLACNSPKTRRIFIGIVFRTWSTRFRSLSLTTRPPRSHTKTFGITSVNVELRNVVDDKFLVTLNFYLT